MNLAKNLKKTSVAFTVGFSLIFTSNLGANVLLDNNNIEAQASTTKTTYKVNASTNLREKPNTKSKSIAKVKKGTKLSGLKSHNKSWYKLTYSGKTRYILKTRITVVKSSTTTSKSVNSSFNSNYTKESVYSKKYPKTYEALEKAVLNGNETANVVLSEFKNGEYAPYVGDIFKEIDYNNPTKVVDRYFHLPTISEYTYWSNGKVELTYTLSKTTRNKYIDESNKKIASVAKSLANPTDSEYKKVKAVNDYVKKSMDYDYGWQKGNDNIVSHLVYGGIVKNYGVCDAYSKTVEALLNYMGVEAGVIQGKGSGVAHSWNYVKIDGKYYYLDATFDDTGETTEYFLINTAQMVKDHKWDKNAYPKATSTKYLK